MKTKKVLFKTSGIFKCIVGGCVLGLFLLILLLSGLLKEMLIEDVEMLDSMVQEMIQEDPEYTFLLKYSTEELVDYLLGTVNIFSAVMVIMGATSITLGVFTILAANKYDFWFRNNLKTKIIFTIFDYLFYIGLIFNILTSVALFIKDKPLDEIVIEN